MRIHVEAYGNGYRPTAEGTIDEKRFFFRMDGSGRWTFGVVRPGSGEGHSFLSGDDELEFRADGDAGKSLYHDEALPVFLSALDAYLAQRGVADGRAGWVAAAKAQAAARLDPGDRRF